jgi:hypothetical protein
MLSTFVHSLPRTKLVAVLAAAVCSLTMGLALTTASAEAASPAPACVTTFDHFPYTDVTNNCRTTLQLWVRYTFAHTRCTIFPPGASTTFWRAAPWNRYVITEICP